MTDSQYARKKRQDAAVQKAIEQLSVSMASHPAVRMNRLFVFLGGDHGTSGSIYGFDDDSIDELIERLQVLKEDGLDDLPDGPGIGSEDEPDYPDNVVTFPSDRGWS